MKQNTNKKDENYLRKGWLKKTGKFYEIFFLIGIFKLG